MQGCRGLHDFITLDYLLHFLSDDFFILLVLFLRLRHVCVNNKLSLFTNLILIGNHIFISAFILNEIGGIHKFCLQAFLGTLFPPFFYFYLLLLINNPIGVYFIIKRRVLCGFLFEVCHHSGKSRIFADQTIEVHCFKVLYVGLFDHLLNLGRNA